MRKFASNRLCFTECVHAKLGFLYKITPEMENLRDKIRNIVRENFAPSIYGSENIPEDHLEYFSINPKRM